MAKLKKREIKKALKELMFEAAPLSTNKGRVIPQDHCHNKRTPKVKRHMGWVMARWAEKGNYKKEIEEGNDPIYFYDSWRDLHDGLANWQNYKDVTHIKNNHSYQDEKREEIRENNQRLKRMTKIREARLAKKKLLLK